MKTEKEKMLSGEPYDCGDPELFGIWCEAKELMHKYNSLHFAERKAQKETLTELLGAHGENIFIAAPFFVDYGKFIRIGNNTEINMNCVFLDCNWITIGENCLIAPNVQIYAVGHPVRASERFPQKSASKEFSFAVGLTAPVTIGNHVWIGGGSIILPGVTIGDNVTIGAGSVVNKSIPANSLAAGNPCRVIRKLD